jgi:hypothetical protein
VSRLVKGDAQLSVVEHPTFAFASDLNRRLRRRTIRTPVGLPAPAPDAIVVTPPALISFHLLEKEYLNRLASLITVERSHGEAARLVLAVDQGKLLRGLRCETEL